MPVLFFSFFFWGGGGGVGSKSIGGGWAGAERGWVISFLTLGKGWVVQFSATAKGWVILLFFLLFFWGGGWGDWQIFDTINNKGNSLNASYASGTLNNLVPRADVPLGQHQDTELWNNQQALSQSPRVFYF